MTADDPSTVWDQRIIADCRDAHRWNAGDPTLLLQRQQVHGLRTAAARVAGETEVVAVSEARVCIVCQRTKLEVSQLQTCVACVGAIRTAILDILQDYALIDVVMAASEGAATPMDPTGRHSEVERVTGGDAMVLVGPGSSRWHYGETGADSIAGTLGRWEDDWRVTLEAPAAKDPFTVTGCAAFLLRGLSHMAQHHPAFDEFATDMRQLCGAVKRSIKDGAQSSPVPCLTCGARRLERPMPNGGRRFEWQCAKCHRNYTESEYWMAARQQGDQEVANGHGG